MTVIDDFEKLRRWADTGDLVLDRTFWHEEVLQFALKLRGQIDIEFLETYEPEALNCIMLAADLLDKTDKFTMTDIMTILQILQSTVQAGAKLKVIHEQKIKTGMMEYLLSGN